jgi:hypothetical protein
MPSTLSVSTPQFRTALLRKLKNIAPTYTPEFVEAEQGIAFRMKDRQGRVRSLTVTIYRNSGDTLHRTRLEARLRSAGFPAVKK